MKILIYGINYAPELVGIGKYSGEMGIWLVEHGYGVRVITAPPYYPEWKIWPKYSSYCYSKSIDKGVTVWRCPLFVPKTPNALLRIIHLVSFSISSLPIILMQLLWRPTIVLVVVPTLFCAPQALLLAKLTRAKSILHIQDFEIDALFGLKLTTDNLKNLLLRRTAFWFESKILKLFDKVSTISSGMLLLAEKKGVFKERLLHLPNWTDLSRCDNVSRSLKILSRFGLDGTKKVILYSGNIVIQ